jgi:hypothetical protein
MTKAQSQASTADVECAGARVKMSEPYRKVLEILRQTQPHCKSVSFSEGAALAFMQYASVVLRCQERMGGVLYGTVEDGHVHIEVVYEPSHWKSGGPECFSLDLGTKDDKRADDLAQLLR